MATRPRRPEEFSFQELRDVAREIGGVNIFSANETLSAGRREVERRFEQENKQFAQEQANEEIRKQRRVSQTRGRASTIVTRGAGLLGSPDDEASLSRRTLLGV